MNQLLAATFRTEASAKGEHGQPSHQSSVNRKLKLASL